MISERKEGEMCCCLFRIVAQVYELLFCLGVLLKTDVALKDDRTILFWKGADIFKKHILNVIDTTYMYY